MNTNSSKRTATDTHRFRTSVAAASAVLLLGACGSGSGGNADTGAGDSQASSSASAAADASFDPSLLPSTPLDPSLLIAVEQESAPNPIRSLTSVIDECSALDPGKVTDLVQAADTLGLSYAFTSGPTDRASCRFSSDPHGIELFVHRADALDEDFIAAFNGWGGDISSRPGGGSGEAVLYFEDSFDVVTFFAARAERDGWAAVVTNAGGTGMLESDEEYDTWGDLASAALDGVDGVELPPPGSEASAPGADPCAVFEPEDLEPAFGVEFNETVWQDSDTPVCAWKTADESVVVSLAVGPAADGPRWFGPVQETGDGVWTGEFGNASVVARGEQLYQVSVVVRHDAYGLGPYEYGGVDERDTQPLVDALVANIVGRTA